MNNAFQNSQIDLSQLPDWRDVTFKCISTKYRYVIIAQSTIVAIIICAAIFFFSWVEENFLGKGFLIACSIVLLLIMIYTFFALWSVKKWGYAIRQHDVMYRSGILSKSVEIIPIKYIQSINIREGFFDRLFNLSSIEVHSAGADISVKIAGISKGESEAIQAYVSEKIN